MGRNNNNDGDLLSSLKVETGMFFFGVTIGTLGLYAANSMHDMIKVSFAIASPVQESEITSPQQLLLYHTFLLLLFFLLLLLIRMMYLYVKKFVY